MKMQGWVAGLVMGCSAVAMQAQMGAAPAPGTKVEPAKTADALITGVEGDFIRLIEAMPADKFDFAPSADMFKSGDSVNFKGVRTFAQLVTHTIQANYFYWGSATGLKPDADVAAIAKLTAKDDIVKAAKASLEFGHKAAATITAENAFEAAGRGPGATRITTIAGGVIHIRDEYGQMVEYLRMNGVVPPASDGKPLANPSKAK